MKIRPAVIALAILAVQPLPAARAAESYDGCKYVVTSLPAVLATQGVWCLKQDLATAIATGAAITIAANNVTLDCNHFKVGGLAAGTGTLASGIAAANRTNVTVRNCNVRGFYYGIRSGGLVGATIEDNTFEFITSGGLFMDTGSNTLVRRNRVSDIGGSTANTTGAFGIFVENDGHILDNVISGISPSADPSSQSVVGIATYIGTGTVDGNRIQALTSKGSGVARGILHTQSWRIASRGNFIDTNAQTGSVGITCSNVNGVAIGNTLLGTSTGVSGCASVDNYIDVD